ncbi:hypothetical protein [Paenibacillus sp. 453mf]|uniref:hypothetical protein n=1 Tax=Paenibacillus sp. 453mf TaxID=1761874 RepID=UPI0008E4B5AF|nr:hypothetical protein [Paenibacillus sp. 453mf]SFS69959.1 hypothetical protein SAMN04488601_10266 [Paenibacillus sp. 453mf]
MNTLLIALFLILPFILSAISLLFKPIQRVLHFIALFCFYAAGICLLISVYHTNMSGMTFTTQIHHILLDPLFVIPAAYLGIYIPFLIITYFLLSKKK